MDVKRVIAAMVAFAFLCGVSRGATGKSPDEIRGTITLTAADGTVLPGAGARVTLRCGTDDVVRVGTADDDGVFRFSELPLDTYSVETELQGFESATVVIAAGAAAALALHLEPTPLRAGILVTGRPGSVSSNPKRNLPRRPPSPAMHACNQSVGMRTKHRRAETGAHPNAVR